MLIHINWKYIHGLVYVNALKNPQEVFSTVYYKVFKQTKLSIAVTLVLLHTGSHREKNLVRKHKFILLKGGISLESDGASLHE